MEHYDVIIIGAGPAGSSCAKTLVENGVKTLIIEKKQFPRFKCCAGLLSKESNNFINKNFGRLPDKLITGKNIRSKFTKRISNNLNSDIVWDYCIKRELFDQWLIDESKVEVFNGLFTHLEQKQNYIEIFVAVNNEKIRLTCKFLIGADGGNSFVRSEIDKNFSNQKNKYLYKQSIFSGTGSLEDNTIYFIISNKIYTEKLSCFYKKAGAIYIGISYPVRAVNKTYLKKTFTKLQEKYQLKGSFLRNEACISTILENNSRYYYGKNNVLIIGEASGLYTSLFEGIPFALISGKKAALSILENQNRALDTYQELIANEEKIIKESWIPGSKN